MRWFINNMQFFLPLLIVIISVMSRMIKAVAEQKQQADARRAGGRPASLGNPEGAMFQPAEVSVQNRPAATTQSELAAQRQAQIEVWKARQAALGEPMQSSSTPGGAPTGDVLANRRRLAMEELRRREIQVDQMRARQTTGRQQPVSIPPASPRAATGRRRSAAPAEASATATTRSSIIGDVIAATAAPHQPQPGVVPASRTTPVGSLVFGPESLRQAFIMKGLLDPPLALRDNSAGFGAGYDQPV